MSENLLEIDSLSIRLPRGADRPFAVENLSLTVAPGEIVCVVGETGSGKSLTAMATMGLLPPNLAVANGEIRFEGRNLLSLPEPERRKLAGQRLAMVFQEPAASLNPIYRVGTQVAETFRLHTDLDRSAIRERVLTLFEEVRLPNPAEILNAYPHQLSGGQCQRVMIATALALDPSLLIADEPTTALDVTTQAQILRLMLDLRERHRTGILFITHDFGVVAEIADKVAVMHRGKLVEVGPAQQLLSEAREDYTRRLLAAVPRLAPRKARPRAGELVLAAKDIVKTYVTRSLRGGTRQVNAVQNISLSVAQGETVGLVGESGSGKSTLAQCVIRLVEPDGGAVTIAGSGFTGLTGAELRKARQRVQIVFQDPYTALDPRQRIGSAIMEGPMIHGTPRSQAAEKARELLSAVGLDPAAFNRFPHEFSGGQRQRICIARALAVEPRLLIADESVSALDVSVQAQILDLLARMQEQLKFGMLFITHDLRVASQICDRIAVMRHGKLLELDEPAQLFAAPKHDYTRNLLASVPGRDWQNAEPAKTEAQK